MEGNYVVCSECGVVKAFLMPITKSTFHHLDMKQSFSPGCSRRQKCVYFFRAMFVLAPFASILSFNS